MTGTPRLPLLQLSRWCRDSHRTSGAPCLLRFCICDRLRGVLHSVLALAMPDISVHRKRTPCWRAGIPAAFRRVMPDSPAASSDDAAPAPRRRRVSAEQMNQAVADQELMRRVVSGDDSAFSSFYDRLAPGLFSLIYHILQDQKASEDVLQESFLQMWKKAGTYDAERSSVFTWAVMIARNKAIDRVRARQRRTRATDAAVAEAETLLGDAGLHAEGLPARAVLATDKVAEQNDDRQRIRAALHEIGDAQREVITLAFFSGLTQSEISAKLGAPLGTVKARIRRGLLALRDILRSDG